MYDRPQPENILPYPLADLGPEGDRFRHVDADIILERLLENCAGLAAVLVFAAKHEECAQQDVIAAMQVLTDQCNTTRAIFLAWQEEQEETRQKQRIRAQPTFTVPCPKGPLQ